MRVIHTVISHFYKKMVYYSFHRRLKWNSLMQLLLCCSLSATRIHPECSTPNLTSPRTNLYLYQHLDEVSVDVYHCRYKESFACINNYDPSTLTGEILPLDDCFKCTKPHNLTLPQSGNTIEYSDITRNCINAFTNSTFKYMETGFLRNNTLVTYINQCTSTTSIQATISILLTNFEARGDLGQDKLEVGPGNICRYSSGFCHDKNKNIDVIWETNIPKHTSCGNFVRVDVSDAYLFMLNQIQYAVIEEQGKYFALELKNKEVSPCNVSNWETDVEGLIVTQNIIEKAKNDITKTVEELGLEPSFPNKEELYDFLIEVCNTQSRYNTQDLSLQNSLLKEKRIYFNRFQIEIEEIRSRFNVLFYIFVVSISCLLVVVSFLVYYNCKNSCKVVDCNAAKVGKVNMNNGNVYEYIVSDYNINSVYDQK